MKNLTLPNRLFFATFALAAILYGGTKPTPPDPPDPPHPEVHVWELPLHFHPETHRLYPKGGTILLVE